MYKFKNKYRIPSARAPFWDYATEGAYYITMCTFHRKPIFGCIINNRVFLSPLGEIVQHEWNRSFEIRKELFCDTFVIMPNHLHAILRIDHPAETHGREKSVVETHGRASLHHYNYGIAYRPCKSISSFVAGFKSSVTRKINAFRQTPFEPVWQSRFHDHIIRDEEEYDRIQLYIVNNPANWNIDEFSNP